MSVAAMVLCLLAAVLPSVGVGYVLGVGRSEDEGYQRGYREGSFDERAKGGVR